MNLTLRYAIEFSIMIPAAIFAFTPIIDKLRFSRKFTFVSVGVILMSLILAGAFLCNKYFPKVKGIFASGIVILFAVYLFCLDCELNKKLFCFFNAMMLCEFCPMYTTILMGPIELAKGFGPFLVSSGFVCLGLSLAVGIIFFRTLTVKIPMLLNEERIKSIWKYMFLLPLGITIFTNWITPISPKVVMTGRVRPISLLLYLVIPSVVFLFIHLWFWTTAKIVESSRLQQENDLLHIESKRYNELKNYMNETRALRHDFRQHLSVISELAENEEFDELKVYLSQLTAKSKQSYINYCENRAVDAIASHYDKIARSQATKIDWRLELPETLPMNEAEYCAILGNLTENSLHAVKALPEDRREIKIISSMLSDYILGLAIDNPYDEKTSQKISGQGIGLISVRNTVEHYGGTMNITTENETFSVDIILYFSTKNF
ncbi:MAG: GHKL domain-containing protein [Synergistaceae bacterium]|nr:GHKL domain-containing protein [Synergistaceae bacterium]